MAPSTYNESQELSHAHRALVSRTEHASRKRQRVAEELLRLRLLAALPERGRQVARRDQRLLVLRAERAGPGHDDLAPDLRSLGVLALF